MYICKLGGSFKIGHVIKLFACSTIHKCREMKHAISDHMLEKAKFDTWPWGQLNNEVNGQKCLGPKRKFTCPQKKIMHKVFSLGFTLLKP